VNDKPWSVSLCRHSTQTVRSPFGNGFVRQMYGPAASPVATATKTGLLRGAEVEHGFAWQVEDVDVAVEVS
jgi:hypothetical protein